MKKGEKYELQHDTHYIINGIKGENTTKKIGKVVGFLAIGRDNALEETNHLLHFILLL